MSKDGCGFLRRVIGLIFGIMDSRALFLIQSVERLDFWYNGFGPLDFARNHLKIIGFVLVHILNLSGVPYNGWLDFRCSGLSGMILNAMG